MSIYVNLNSLFETHPFSTANCNNIIYGNLQSNSIPKQMTTEFF